MSNTLYELVPITDTKDLKDGWYLLSDGPKINTDWVANPYGQFKGFDWIEVPGTFTHYLRPYTPDVKGLEDQTLRWNAIISAVRRIDKLEYSARGTEWEWLKKQYVISESSEIAVTTKGLEEAAKDALSKVVVMSIAERPEVIEAVVKLATSPAARLYHCAEFQKENEELRKQIEELKNKER